MEINRGMCYQIIYDAHEIMNRPIPNPEKMFFLSDFKLDKMRLNAQLEAQSYINFTKKRQCLLLK